jgi:hypothetical protein
MHTCSHQQKSCESMIACMIDATILWCLVQTPAVNEFRLCKFWHQEYKALPDKAMLLCATEMEYSANLPALYTWLAKERAHKIDGKSNDEERLFTIFGWDCCLHLATMRCSVLSVDLPKTRLSTVCPSSSKLPFAYCSKQTVIQTDAASSLSPRSLLAG